MKLGFKGKSREAECYVSDFEVYRGDDANIFKDKKLDISASLISEEESRAINRKLAVELAKIRRNNSIRQKISRQYLSKMNSKLFRK